MGVTRFKLHANCEADQLRRTRELIVKLRGHARGSGSTIFSSRKHVEPLRVNLGLCCLANHQAPSYLNSPGHTLRSKSLVSLMTSSCVGYHTFSGGTSPITLIEMTEVSFLAMSVNCGFPHTPLGVTFTITYNGFITENTATSRHI